ncbi:MAG: ribosomal-processing cysteine protease Prp [Bacillota bacterium]
MVEIRVFFEKDLIKGFEIKGHAGFAQKGQDIVCSAVSVLAQTAVLAFYEFFAENKFAYSQNNGYLSCMLSADLDNNELDRSQIILKTIYLGMKSIEDNYSAYVKIVREV